MASAKKKTNSKGPAPKSKRAEPVRRSYHREVLGGVSLLLALCALVTYFQADAIFLRFFAVLLKGLLGYGYWMSAPLLAAVGVILLLHKGRPVRLRLTCTMLLPLLISSLLHLLLCRVSYEPSLGIIAALWGDGQMLACGGVLSGILAVGLSAVFGKLIAGILFGVGAVVCLFVALRRTPMELIRKVRESRPVQEDEPEQMPVAVKQPEAERKPAAKKAVRSPIDIPLDDPVQNTAVKPEQPEDVEVLLTKGAKKRFFAGKPDHVRTPDQVLQSGEDAPVTEKTEEGQEPQVQPVVSRRRRAELTAQEVDKATAEVSRAIESELAEPEEAYQYPPISLLTENHPDNYGEVGAELRNNSRRLAQVLQSFGVDAQAGEVVHGPSVTRYEFTLDQGVKLSKLTNLSDDIALALGASGVRIAPVPGKISAVGIEVPNRAVTAVRIRDVIESRNFVDHPSRVAFSVGKDIGGNCIVGDISRLPHVLIAGTTGSGKSVCTNSLIISMLYKSTPDEVRFIMVDPKMVELAPYNGIPHLLIPVVTDPKKAAGALQWAVYEMMKRYKMFSEKGVKDLAGYNALEGTDEDVKKLPTVVVVIDELADLMLVAAKEVEESICRVAQMGRAAGMHLVIATQRPSADVITGLMKANIPSRIAFAVASGMESRIILDNTGAEKLVGKGDMLYFPLGSGKPVRVQGCFITPEEIDRVVGFVKESGEAEYSNEVMEKIEEVVRREEKGGKQAAQQQDTGDDGDELLPAAVEVVLETGQASVSMLQRRMKLGYSRAARLVDQMEERGIVGPFEGSKPRQLLIDRAKWQEMQMGSVPQPEEPEIDRYGSIHDVFESHDALE
ncbi:MAG: DNA translocase FtsK [Ruminococcaceae bacterium]|nr:DNA translocase FtsK [Oscillospiraceae bacterium]